MHTHHTSDKAGLLSIPSAERRESRHCLEGDGAASGENRPMTFTALPQEWVLAARGVNATPAIGSERIAHSRHYKSIRESCPSKDVAPPVKPSQRQPAICIPRRHMLPWRLVSNTPSAYP